MRRLTKDESFLSFMLRNHPPGEMQVMDIVSFFAIMIPCLLLTAGICYLFPRLDMRDPGIPLIIFGLYCVGKLAYIRSGED